MRAQDGLRNAVESPFRTGQYIVVSLGKTHRACIPRRGPNIFQTWWSSLTKNLFVYVDVTNRREAYTKTSDIQTQSIKAEEQRLSLLAERHLKSLERHGRGMN